MKAPFPKLCQKIADRNRIKHSIPQALEYLWSYLDLKEYPQQARMQDPDLARLLEVDSQSRIIFAHGWIDGVLSIWQTIKTQIDGDGEVVAKFSTSIDS